MAKYTVYYTQKEIYCFEIDAESEEDANMKANSIYEEAEKKGELGNYHDDSDCSYDTYEEGE